VDLKFGNSPLHIPEGYTEIYFWGNPGSGKTCALGAILRTGTKSGELISQGGDGIMYMTQLTNIFFDNKVTLPGSTPVDKTQLMSCLIKDKKDKKTDRPTAFIEISGEVFKYFAEAYYGREKFNQNPNTEMEEKDHGKDAFLLLSNLMGSENNPKLHFFVVDVSDKGRMDEFNLIQQNYLQAAASYFQNMNLFNSKTSGIFILMTKSDLLTNEESKRLDLAENFLNEYCREFVESLRDIVKKNKSTSNVIKYIPFTLGEVYLQEKCLFNPETSKDILELLQRNTFKSPRRNVLSKALNK